MNDEYIKGYKEGYIDGVTIKEYRSFMKSTIFGMDLGKVLEIVSEHIQREQSKLPLGFNFPFKEYESWDKCCGELYKQGWKIVKESKT